MNLLISGLPVVMAEDKFSSYRRGWVDGAKATAKSDRADRDKSLGYAARYGYEFNPLRES